MKILVSYATSEGHTRKIARWIADRIYDQGHSVELLSLVDKKDIDLGRFDGAILASSVHVGHYQPEVAEFAGEHATRLAQMPTLFLSVSLSAAGHDADDWRGLERILDDFTDATNWTPDRVVQVAGAYMPSEYGVLSRFVMRRIIAGQDPEADLDADHDYTDWEALGSELDSWLAQAEA
ncbi:Protoporphyrinogen IX dehydrogenase [menaquinone] [Aliiroseovarius pelagivivens]|uniref:Protoporphyrinogen IX dehydrogenase [menaquinone] n=1 Tax=Aliiroseovarius pelagivivens TaxID=1639690 RepID=A0A2R8AH02_9RHOB|nr:flavodoxin domain-containing protein [Aliiroseovarius pelagivivens]SPF75114.1 Protoporphyrinogen IX dehydrogenase [menaquinone] [Aliiroseovarius pelagivivens]